MIRQRGVRLAIAFVVVLLAACAAPRTRPLQQPNEQLLAGQTAREQKLAADSNWGLSGRLGVSDGHDGGSGSLEWTQHGAQFRFSVHAPVTGKTWTLSGRPQHAVLEGLRDQPVDGDDAAALLEHELGWRVPVAELAYWVRGMRAALDARIAFGADGLPATIVEAGWTVQYQDYDTTRQPPLPGKVFASKGEYKVRLAIRDWAHP
jgi:outer membrane lipoprotein LolB